MRLDAGVTWYLGLAFSLAWAAWAVPLLLGVDVRSPLFQFFAVPGGFAPAVAAFVVRRWVSREGFSDAGLRLNLSKWRYYLAAAALPLLVLVIIVLAAGALGLGQPNLTLGPALRELAPGRAVPSSPYLGLLILPQLLIGALVVTPLLFGEEFGWRGYLQKRLWPGNDLAAAIVTGLIWGVWHLPLVMRGYQFPGQPILGLMVFSVTTVLLSIIFGWLERATQSVWAPSLAHAATNAVGGSVTLLWFYGQGNTLWLSYLGVLGWPALGALCLWIVITGRLGSAAATRPVSS